MRILFLSLLLLFANGARAEDEAALAAPDRAAIQDIISGQLRAFKDNDADKAFDFASPNIQGLFGSAQNFSAMVRNGYPPVWRPRSVEFGAIVEQNGRIVQKVEIIGPDGAPALALYTMEKQPDGSWRIDGCALTTSERVSA